MKKLSKFIYFIFAFALIACMSIFNPAIDFASADTVVDSDKIISISNSKIQDTIEAGQSLIVPIPKVSNESLAKFVQVTDRSGTVYTYDCENRTTNGKTDVKYFVELDKDLNVVASDDTTTAIKYLKVANHYKGTYTVQYKVVDEANNKTYFSDAKQIQVKSVSHSWEMYGETGSKNLIPSITAQATEENDTTFALPLPKILGGDAPITYSKADIEGDDKKIIVTNSGDDVTADVLSVKDGDDNIYFTPLLAEGIDEDTYIIKYVSKVTAFPNKTFTVKVVRDYNTDAELEATHDTITNYQVGATTTFPTINVTDKTHNKTKVEVNSTIVIKRGGAEHARLEANQYTYKFTETGTYTIQYEVEDAYGNTTTSKAKSITLSDKKPYMIAFADSYTTTETGWEDNVNTNITHTIPNEVGYGGFWVPAVYGKDYVDGYSDLKFSRRLVSTADSSVYFDIDSNDAVHGNAAYVNPGEGKNRWNEVIRFEFPSSKTDKAEKLAEIKEKYAGQSFKLVYTVKDSNSHNTELKATEYIIKIAGEDVLTNNVDKNLIINFPTINDSIDPSATLTFTTATAKEEPTNSSLVADERVEVKTFYYYGNKTVIENLLKDYITEKSAGNKDYIEKYGYEFDKFEEYIEKTNPNLDPVELENNSGKTDVTLTGYTNQPVVTIYAVAINDQNQFVIKAQEVAINNTSEDTAPTISEVKFLTGKSYDEQLKGTATKFNQNYEVWLPSVTFADYKEYGNDESGFDDTSLQVDIKCYVDTPDQTVGITIDEFVQNLTGECGIKTAKLTTTYAGTYYVVYTATDDAGNTTTYVSTFEVEKTEKAYIEVENGSNISKNVGEEVKLNINLAGNGKYDNQKITIEWGDNKPSGLGSQPNSYRFDKAGTYVATISAEYTMNSVKYTDTPSVTVTITVTEPEMTWADDIDEILVNRTANENELIELPVISAIENGVEINAVPKVVFIDENDNETEVELTFNEETFNSYSFVAKNDGVYKVTYTSTTAYNSESKSFTITCGDHYDPTIIVGNNKLQGSKVTYNGTNIEVSANLTQKEDNSGDLITGKYTLTVVGKTGNKEVFSYDIDVDLKDTNAKEEIDFFTPKTRTISLNGNSVSSNGNNKWTISGVGDYELKLTVKDNNGNTETKSITFKVANKTEPKSIKDSVVGIVLIVVSVVVLGGVILFFALAGKRNKSRKSSIRNNKD